MARHPSPNNPACPRCGAAHVIQHGHTPQHQQRWLCRGCGRTFGPTFGTPLYRLRTSACEVAHSLLVVMRRGSLSAAEEITGHKYETIGQWLKAAATHAEALTQALVHDLHLTAVEADAFWSFVKKNVSRREEGTTRRRGRARAGAA